MTGKHFEQPQEYDDPNATISSILTELKAFVSNMGKLFIDWKGEIPADLDP